tara:strand:- start:1689 stop:2165 length:477 start_codon:yes stop_codon:yes gene_type:complete
MILIEYEIRISNIGKSNFDTILSILNSCPYFEKLIIDETETYYSSNIRFNNRTNQLQSKIKLFIIDESYHNFNIRFCKSKEETIHQNINSYTAKFTRQKHRIRFIHKHWHIDLTHVINNNTYELEIEIDNNYGNTHSTSFIHKILTNELKNLLTWANL